MRAQRPARKNHRKFTKMNKVSAKYSGQALAMVAALFALPGCHSQKATVLPKGGNAFEVVAQSSNE